jgi:molybdopterin-containing oxidoreductase family iron-sulfur binding subunit
MRTKQYNVKGIDVKKLRQKLALSSGERYWKSLQELAQTPEFKEYLDQEFPAGTDEVIDPVGRRRFLQLMGASLALAGLGACTRQPDEMIVPHVRAPEEVIPGKPLFYASTFPHMGFGMGLLVESHDGRPTKIEGNPLHPASLGATNAFAQASLLELYDPDRPRTVSESGRLRTWEAFSASLASEMERFQVNGGTGLHILTGTVSSPTLASQLMTLLDRLPNARWHQYEPVNLDAAVQGARNAFGRDADTHYQLRSARVILSLDSDFLNSGPGAVRYSKDFAERSRIFRTDGGTNRLYMVESSPTVSGTMADHRLTVQSRAIEEIACLIARELGLDVPLNGQLDESTRRWAAEAALDLRRNPGESAILAGGFQPASVHALAHWINEKLGNHGSTVIQTDPVRANPVNQLDSLRDLNEALEAGTVSALIIIGGDPGFDAPSDFDFAAKLSGVPFSAHLSLHHNETSQLCQWQIPESHFLESWGDLRAFDGTASVVQPLITPLYRSKSALELVAAMQGRSSDSSHDLVKEYWQNNGSDPSQDSDRRWKRSLHDGVIEGSTFPAVSLPVDTQGVLGTVATGSGTQEGLEIMFRPDPSIFDGRFANNAWLQELPKPLSKLTWDNAALIAPGTAEELDLADNDVVELSGGKRSLRIPVWIQPGHPGGSITVHFGYGRNRVGGVGTSTGFNAYRLRTSESFWSSTGVELRKTGEQYPLACTQDHHSMEGRDLVRTSTLQELQENPRVIQEHGHAVPENAGLYPGFEYSGYAWGMAVDLNACTGCNACVVACQAENNIAVVGKDQVLMGREMHWIRIDRYYGSSIDSPDVYHQPVMCQQCENAPCESVCPVAATVHSSEGLNDMVYNRCVGTRYCANNCPYKVRRFNFLLYSDWQTEPLKLQKNPNVTVRSRGVMEKCTYCVQRINAVKIQSRLEDRRVRDGEIKTACQQVCPADAIVFGDINDPASRVSQLKKSQRNYEVLTEIETRPRTSYLAKVRNPNKEIET